MTTTDHRQSGTVAQAASPFDSIRRTREDGSEFWSARDLMPLMGYEKWERFEDAVERALVSLGNAGQDVEANASRLREASGKTERADFHLSRFAAYLVAMNGDPRKPEVAAAQAYFAIRTHEAETRQAAAAELTRADLARMVLAAEAESEAKTRQIETMTPKAEYVDTYVADDDLRLMRNVAKSLAIAEQDLRRMLIDARWIYAEASRRWSEREQRVKEQTRYSPMADKARYFRPVPVHDAPRFRGEVMHTLKVTPEGATAIARLVERRGLALVSEVSA